MPPVRIIAAIRANGAVSAVGNQFGVGRVAGG